MKPLEYPHFTQSYIARIVDGNNPMFEDLSDEKIVDFNDRYVDSVKTVFWKPYQHKIRLAWRTFLGTPETVKTVYYTPIMES